MQGGPMDAHERLLMNSLLLGDAAEDLSPLPPPTEDSLPELVTRLADSSPAVVALLLRQLAGVTSVGGAADSPPDYVGSLCALAAPLRQAAARAPAGALEESESKAAISQSQLATVLKTLL